MTPPRHPKVMALEAALEDVQGNTRSINRALKSLLTAVAAPPNAKLLEGSRALYLAAQLGHTAVVKKLLPWMDASAFESAAAIFAAQQGHTNIVELLLPHSDPSSFPAALFWAAETSNTTLISMLTPLISTPYLDATWERLLTAKPPLYIGSELLAPYVSPTGIEQQAHHLSPTQTPLAQARLLAEAIRSQMPQASPGLGRARL